MSSLLLLLILVGLAIWLSNRSTPQRDAAAAQSWANFHHYAATNGWPLLEIHSRYEDWSQGSKAYVSIYGAPTGIVRDAWFWWHHVQPGSVVAVHGFGEGWGPHTGKDGVLYIGDRDLRQSGVTATFNAKELTKARRHWNRQQQTYFGRAA